MIDPKKLEQLSRQVQESLPRGIRHFGEDMEKKIRQILQNQFKRMDLVSREEFDVQTKVLLRTREKLSQLELRLNALENMSKNDQLFNKKALSGSSIAVSLMAGEKSIEENSAEKSTTSSSSEEEESVPKINISNDKLS